MIRIFTSALLVVISFAAYTCDVCGASNSIGGFGTYANGNRTNFGLNYQFKTYKSHHPALFNEPIERSSELFQRWELKSQIRLSKRFQGNINLPMVFNQQTKNNVRSTKFGLGDAAIGLAYFIFNQKDSTSGNTFRWNVGLGGKLPTGQFTHPDSSDLMLYGGSGSFDAYFTNLLFYQVKKWSFVSESSIYLRGSNKFAYQAGNTFTTSLMANRKMNNFSLYTGFQFVWVGSAYENNTHIIDSPTVGTILTNLWGLTYSKNNWLFQGAYHIPLVQNLGNSYTTQKQAFSLSLYYFI